MPLGIVLVGGCRSQLHGAEGARVDVALHLQDPFHKFRVRGQHAHAPSRHVVAFAHGIEFDAALLGTWHLQDAQPLMVEDEAVRVVVDDDDVVPLREVHQFFVGFATRVGTRGHVRIIAPKDFHARQVHLFQGIEIRLPSVFGQQVVVGDLLPEQFAERGVGGIAGVGHQHPVAGIGEGERHVQDAFLGADERLDFAVRVQVHAVPAFVECGHGAAQFRDAHGGLVAMRVGLVCFFTQCLDGLRRRGHVGASDSQADDVLAFRVHASHFFELHREVVFFHGGQPVGGPYVRVKLSVFHLDILLKF